MGKPRKPGVCEPALNPREAGKAHGRKAKVSNRTWENRPSGIIGGPRETWLCAGAPELYPNKLAVCWTRLSCHRFRGNEVRLWLSMIAYNLGNLWRRLALPNRIRNWSLTSLQQRLVKTGGRLVKHARYYWLLLAEGHLTRGCFGSML